MTSASTLRPSPWTTNLSELLIPSETRGADPVAQPESSTASRTLRPSLWTTNLSELLNPSQAPGADLVAQPGSSTDLVQEPFSPEFGFSLEELHGVRDHFNRFQLLFHEGLIHRRLEGKTYKMIVYRDQTDETKNIAYILLKELQNTRNGLVSTAIDLNGKEVVIKYIPDDKVGVRELSIYQLFDTCMSNRAKRYYVYGPHFRCAAPVRDLRAPLSPNSGFTGLVLPYLSGGDLLDYFNRVLSVDSTRYAREIFPVCLRMARTVSYLHQYGIVHRDVKLENFILDGEGNVRLADFGLAVHAGDPFEQAVGSLGYVDPAFFKDPLPAQIHPSCDIWSLGVCMQILVHGSEFKVWTEQRKRNFAKLASMSEADFSQIKDRYLPRRNLKGSLDSVINSALRLDPAKRMVAREMVKRLHKSSKVLVSLSKRSHPTSSTSVQ